MKVLTLLMLAVFITILTTIQTKPNCEDEKECPSEYFKYIKCVRSRGKRSVDCEEAYDDEEEPACSSSECSCKQCDCTYCNIYACKSFCYGCCQMEPCKTTRCCHKSCHSNCNTVGCRKDCKKNCMNKTIIVESNNTVSEKILEKIHNITTIVNLQNVINNTNILDIPINNTNVFNIAAHLNMTQEKDSEMCCYVIGPRQCSGTDIFPFIRCVHYRRKHCGPICKAAVIHEQKHNVCEQTSIGTSCNKQMIYIPQPQPKCTYQRRWPYVFCGKQQHELCEGCYSHYGTNHLPQPHCPSTCYDEGFDSGPLYRQGPIYRPLYCHIPPCYDLRSCGYENKFYDYGGYGKYPVYPPYGIFGDFGIPSTGHLPDYENSYYNEAISKNRMNFTIDSAPMDSLQGEKIEVPYYSHFNTLGYPYILPHHVNYISPEVSIQESVIPGQKERASAAIIEIDNTKDDPPASETAPTPRN